MKITTKVLLGILISVFLFDTFWVAREIRENILSNQMQREEINNEQTQELYKKLNIINRQLTELFETQNYLDSKIDNLPTKQKMEKFLLEKKLQQISVVIINKTTGYLGSGVTLKYNENFYILSAGHLIQEETDEIYFMENDQIIGDLEIVKVIYNPSEDTEAKDECDLLLLKPKNKNLKPKVYAELEDFEPATAEEIYIVGNPLGLEDVLSMGRVTMYQDNFMYFRNATYFGNSGGGVFNLNGRLVGIMSHIRVAQPYYNIPAFVLEGAVRLNTIKDFLNGVD